MARKRLTAPQEIYLARAETPGLTPPFSSPALSTAPIAMIAGEATAVSGLREMAGVLEAARAEGRLVQSLPLDAIEADHLIRDRVIGDAEEMAALKESLRVRGQQQPIDVVDLGGGRYGLISGWRRLSALRELHAETGETRFGHVQALLRRPDGASDAYLAMVEENEIRANLSHYERARIAALAAEQGVFATPQEALRHLFANASRAKRSKIGSFMVLHRELGSVLAFPAAIPERLGLALAQALDGGVGQEKVTGQTLPLAPDFAAKLRTLLTDAKPQTAEDEARVLAAALQTRKTDSVPQKPVKEIRLKTLRTPLGLQVTLTGNGLTDRLVKRLADWLARQD